MKTLALVLIGAALLAAACAPAAPPTVAPASPSPSPTPSHGVPMPWLLPDGQYLFVEVSEQVDGVVVEGKPAPGANVDMPTYEFDPAAGVLKSRAGFMPPKDSKVLIGVKRSLRGAAGQGASGILTAYNALPAGDADQVRVIAVDGDGGARLGYANESFILRPQESKEFSHEQLQTLSDGKIKLTTQTRVTNLGVQALGKISSAP